MTTCRVEKSIAGYAQVNHYVSKGALTQQDLLSDCDQTYQAGHLQENRIRVAVLLQVWVPWGLVPPWRDILRDIVRFWPWAQMPGRGEDAPDRSPGGSSRYPSHISSTTPILSSASSGVDAHCPTQDSGE